MPLTSRRTSDAATEPVTLAEAKAHLRIDDGQDEDALVNALIKAARQWAEEVTGRAFITQTWTLKLDSFPGCGRDFRISGDVPAGGWRWRADGPIVLPRARAASVTSITYVDENGTTQTLSSSLYQTDLDSEPARIIPAYDQVWPATRDQMNAVTVTYTAGYGAASAVPGPIKQALLLMIGTLYENRETLVVGTSATPLPFAADALLAPYRLMEMV